MIIIIQHTCKLRSWPWRVAICSWSWNNSVSSSQQRCLLDSSWADFSANFLFQVAAIESASSMSSFICWFLARSWVSSRSALSSLVLRFSSSFSSLSLVRSVWRSCSAEEFSLASKLLSCSPTWVELLLSRLFCSFSVFLSSSRDRAQFWNWHGKLLVQSSSLVSGCCDSATVVWLMSSYSQWFN